MSATPTPHAQAAAGGTLAEARQDEGKDAVARPVASAERRAPTRTGDGAPHDRISPDPMRSTDRYRLVTPHTFRL